jgi:hypothetical protein
VQAVAWLAGFSFADAVRQDDVVLAGVEELSLAVQHSGKMLVEQTAPGAAGAVQ